MDGKVCKYCSIFKPYSFYRKEKKGADGYKIKCKDCERPAKHLHYINNKEKYKQAYQDFIGRNPAYWFLYQRNNKYIIKF